MKYFVRSLLFLGVVMIPFVLQAQTDTIRVTSDLTGNTQGNLNTAINTVIQADSINHTTNFSNTVFMLEPVRLLHSYRYDHDTRASALLP